MIFFSLFQIFWAVCNIFLVFLLSCFFFLFLTACRTRTRVHGISRARQLIQFSHLHFGGWYFLVNDEQVFCEGGQSLLQIFINCDHSEMVAVKLQIEKTFSYEVNSEKTRQCFSSIICESSLITQKLTTMQIPGKRSEKSLGRGSMSKLKISVTWSIIVKIVPLFSRMSYPMP